MSGLPCKKTEKQVVEEASKSSKRRLGSKSGLKYFRKHSVVDIRSTDVDAKVNVDVAELKR